MDWNTVIGKSRNQATYATSGIGVLFENTSIAQGLRHVDQAQVIVLPFLVAMS